MNTSISAGRRTRCCPAGHDVVDERHRARQLPVVRAPRDHEHRFDVEDDEQHRHHVELHGEALVRVAERRHARLVRRLFDRGRPRAEREVGEPEHQHRVGDDEAEQEQDREVRAKHESPNFVKTFTKSSAESYPAPESGVNGATRDSAGRSARSREHRLSRRSSVTRDAARYFALAPRRDRTGRPLPPPASRLPTR